MKRTLLIAMCTLALTGMIILHAGTNGSAMLTTVTPAVEHVAKIIPWVEAECLPNSDQRTATGERYYDYILAGLRLWRTSVDTVIVRTDPRPEIYAPVLSALTAELAPMQIIPGVDVNPVLVRSIDNVEGWAKVAESVKKALEITGSTRYLIDCEMAIQDMRKGVYVPDWDQVRAGLSLLPKDAACIWFPSISCWVDRPTEGGWCDDDLALQTELLKCVVETLPDVTLVTFELDGHGAPASDGAAARYKYVQEHFETKMMPVAYFQIPKWCWKPGQILQVRDLCQVPEMAVYTGVTNWMACANTGPLQLRNDLQGRLASTEQAAQGADARAVAAESRVEAMRKCVAAAESALESLRQRVASIDAELISTRDSLAELFESSTPEMEPIESGIEHP